MPDRELRGISSERDVIDFCDCALSLAPDRFPLTHPASSDLIDVSAWCPFETAACALGEDVRYAFSRNPKLKKNRQAVLKVLEVATCRNLRRGRQPFVLTLGFVGAREHAIYLVKSLADPDVNGQVVETLLKMRAAGFAEEVRRLLEARHAGIRRLAQRYLVRYPNETAP